MHKKIFFLNLVIAATAFTMPVNAGSVGYYVDHHGEFRKMRCSINGTPVSSRHQCAEAAHLARTQRGWSHAQGPGVPAYYEVGLPKPRSGRRYLHNQPVWHEHRGPHVVYQHYGYLGHHQYKAVPKVPNRIVHTGGGAGGSVYGIEE